MNDPIFHIALYQPEIPPNTGNIGRLAVGIQARLHLIHPLGFALDEKRVRRAGLDYWPHLDLVEHETPEAFWEAMTGKRVHLFSTKGKQSYAKCGFERGDVLLFGRETKGLPESLIAERGAYTIPMTGETRSLNLSNSVAIVSYAALERLSPELFE